MTSGQDSCGNAGTPAQPSPALQHLLERTKYPLVQENGHRRYGPPPDWEGPPPPKGCEVYVAKIPRDMFEDELVPVMERAGRLYEMRLMQDHEAANRGYGFVQYCSLPEAETALRILKDVEVRPKRNLGVSRSVDNNRLFVGGIPKTCSREEVFEEMRRVTEGVVKVILYPCINDRTKNRGYAFVEYTSHKAALMARRKLFSGRQQLWGAEVKVDWAEPEHSVDSDTMAKLHFDHTPPSPLIIIIIITITTIIITIIIIIIITTIIIIIIIIIITTIIIIIIIIIITTIIIIIIIIITIIITPSSSPSYYIYRLLHLQVRVLYVRNLALRTTEDDIRSLCEGIASGVERVKKQKDYAFVHFSSREKAENAKELLNGRLVDGCELEVSWAKPVKNREEYHLKKAQGRQMVGGVNVPQPGYLQHLSYTGEPVMVVPHMRKAAGTHALHLPHQTLPPHTQTMEATLLNLQAAQAASFLSAEAHHLKAPSEYGGVPDGGEGHTGHRGPPGFRAQRVPGAARPAPQPGPPRHPHSRPQYFMPAPQYFMPAPQTMATAPPPQAITAIASQPYLYQASPALAGYEGINPYLQAAFYQQALLTQPAMATLDRQGHRYAAND
ncbi:APOBEC1 complementation factor [Chionoecetes opilio]|uniref:APOBEC1 complementation factor n=1 Tax=Chionoecetes opilio TaxID=41210 RepID=A0A8J5CMK9_CHIOP|nr:APOBEC1 complementation factor [Chionoecetes opilio]